METRKGIPVSPGICIGEAVVLGQEDLRIRRRFVARSKIDGEVARLDAAIQSSVEEIARDISDLPDHLKITRQILESHRAIVADPTLHEEIADRIRTRRNSAEYAVSQVLRGYSRRFAAMASEYISERAHDIADIEKNLVRALLGKRVSRKVRFPKNTALLAHNLTPGETALLDRRSVLGFAVDVGGRTSHTAIMARALQIPAVVGLENVSSAASGGEKIIIDGYTGLVIIDPDRETLEKYREKSSRSESFYVELQREVRLPAQTLDGYEIVLAANIEMPDEIHSALDWGASGIGLYRTEFLYDEDGAPDEEKHYRTYCRAIESLQGRYIVIRTLDAGADKFHAEAVGYQEKNPFLGCRSIRLCFQKPELFRAQLRAILRASSLGPVRIMLPMISNLEELLAAKAVIRRVQEELDREGVPYDRGIPIGIMVEVPSAALAADVFAREVSFFSIGTNDLVQYCMAVDRVNERVAHLYQPAHPSILRLIQIVVEATEKHGIGLSICGEMCGDPIYTTLLLGLGLRSFSVSPISIPTVKRLIRGLSMRDAVEVARVCLSHESAEQTQTYLESHVKTLMPEFV